MAHTDDESVTGKRPAERASSRFGRVEVDARGRNVWRWARDLAESTSVLLKRLQVGDLELEQTRQVRARIARDGKDGEKAELALEGSGGRDAGGGFDPYNHR